MLDNLSGTRLGQHGDYELRSVLGAGGMGVVFDGWDHALNRHVAIKVIRPDMVEVPDIQDRFKTEAELLAKLEHPHIVLVHSFGSEVVNGRHLLYLVMSFAEGGTLADRLKVGPLAIPEVANIVTDIGSALDYAHRMHVVHRDIKPLNIFFDHLGRVLVADFGLAKLIEGGSHVALSRAGTEPYMSPEQMMGGEGDTSADIYALGMMLHEILTGAVPRRAYRDGRIVMELDQRLTGEILAVIARATQTDRRSRYQAAGELAQDFAALFRVHVPDGVVAADEGLLEVAVRDALPGSVLRLAAGTYRLRSSLVIDKPLTLLGTEMEQTRMVCSGEGEVVRYTGSGRFSARDITFAHEGSCWADTMTVRSRFNGVASRAGYRIREAIVVVAACCYPIGSMGWYSGVRSWTMRHTASRSWQSPS